MQRRSFLLGASAALVTPNLIKAAQADTGTTPWAVNFGGNTAIQTDNLSSLTNSSSLLLSYWYRVGTPSAFTETIFEQTVHDTWEYLTVAHLPWDYSNAQRGGYFWFRVWKKDDRRLNFVEFNTFDAGNPTITYDGEWHNLTVSVDSVGLKASLLSDDEPHTVDILGAQYDPSIGAFSNGPGFSMELSGLPLRIGGSVQGANGRFQSFYSGDLTQVFFAQTADYIDLNSNENLQIYREGEPVRSASNGRSLMPGVVPQVYLSGPRDLFLQNLVNYSWDFSAVATNRDSSDFYEATGSLQTAFSDPWGVVAR